MPKGLSRRRVHFGFAVRRPGRRGRRRPSGSGRIARQQHLSARRLPPGPCAGSSGLVFLTRLIWQESNFRSNVSSPAGAQGVAQFMPGTAGERGLVDPFDPEAAIPKNASLLTELRQRFGNLGLAAAAYNAGPARVAKWLAEGGELPLETQNYVSTITRHPIDEWSTGAATKLEEDKVFPECVLRAEYRRRSAAFGPLDNSSSRVLGSLGGPDSRQLQQERGAAGLPARPTRLCLYPGRHQTNDHRGIFWLPRPPPLLSRSSAGGDARRGRRALRQIVAGRRDLRGAAQRNSAPASLGIMIVGALMIAFCPRFGEPDKRRLSAKSRDLRG